MSTVAAISTPNAVGGLAIIRISGENAIEIVGKVFTPFRGKNVNEMDGYTCAYGVAHDGDEHIDNCILTVFKTPHSYTGENVAELSCNGGLFVSRKILSIILKNGAIIAEAGEFTKRAFLNGKIDLTQAESVMDVISAKGELELKIAENLHKGALFRIAKQCSDRLLVVLSGLAAYFDYPDEDIPEIINTEYLLSELTTVRSSLFSLIKNYDCGQIIKEGVLTTIIGRPNVGKSTLFNCLIGFERSIVTDIAGTTRDVVEETVHLGDIILRLSDTAGIRNTDDIIEKKGVEITEKTVRSAELVIAVFDGSCSLTEDDVILIEKIKDMKCVAVINKTDEKIVIDDIYIKSKFIHVVYLSAKKSDGIDKLQHTVMDLFSINQNSFSVVTVANERQKCCIQSALDYIDKTLDAIHNGVFLDAINILIDNAEQYLLELTGEKITEAVVNEVFSRFCVGK